MKLRQKWRLNIGRRNSVVALHEINQEFESQRSPMQTGESMGRSRSKKENMLVWRIGNQETDSSKKIMQEIAKKLKK